jgi:hypothetical protein
MMESQQYYDDVSVAKIVGQVKLHARVRNRSRDLAGRQVWLPMTGKLPDEEDPCSKGLCWEERCCGYCLMALNASSTLTDGDGFAANPALLLRHFERTALADGGAAGADHDVELAGLDHVFHVAVPASEISGAELELDSLRLASLELGA